MAKHKAAPALQETPTIHTASLLHQQFQELSCYKQVIDYLRGGFSLEHIRSLIQEHNHEWSETSPTIVIEKLAKLRHELSAIEKVAPFLPGYVQSAAIELEEGLNEVSEMKELYEIQKNRIMMAYELEKKIKIGNIRTGQELKLGKELLESSYALKKQVGLSPKSESDPLRKVSVPNGLADPKSSNKVLNAVKLLIAKAS